ncbi:hypothetical protein PMIN06_011945 [Paraphaeosphaeria minitans]
MAIHPSLPPSLPPSIHPSPSSSVLARRCRRVPTVWFRFVAGAQAEQHPAIIAPRRSIKPKQPIRHPPPPTTHRDPHRTPPNLTTGAAQCASDTLPSQSPSATLD